MPRGPQERGINTPFRQRIGVDVDTFRGVNKELDPGAILDSEFQELTNIRITPSGAIKERGGQATASDQMGGCPLAIINDEIPDPAPAPPTIVVMIWPGASI